jgi:hypothetical protein
MWSAALAPPLISFLQPDTVLELNAMARMGHLLPPVEIPPVT